jgi:hypothetical protein
MHVYDFGSRQSQSRGRDSNGEVMLRWRSFLFSFSFIFPRLLSLDSGHTSLSFPFRSFFHFCIQGDQQRRKV